MNEPKYDNEILTRYLLGSLSAAETERLDELCITDDEVAASLQAAENELVDSYVRGELSRAASDRFESYYLTSPLRRERVEFAQALHRFGKANSEKPAGAWFSPVTLFQRPLLRWGLVAACLLVVVGMSWLLLQRRKVNTPPDLANQGSRPGTPIQPSPIPSPSELPEDKPTAIAQLQDGDSLITLDQEGKLSGVDGVPPVYQQLIKQALATQRLSKPALLEGLKRQSSPLLGPNDQGNDFSLTEPVGKVLLSDRPTFRWSQLGTGAAYVVEVYDEDFNLVETSDSLSSNSWTLPQPLIRGRAYSWQVKASKDSREFKSPRPPAPQAKFRILDQAKTIELAKARRAYASSHLTLALLYAQAGLLDDAESQLRALQKKNPNSTIVTRLIGSVQALKH